jgi:hypothetical protein
VWRLTEIIILHSTLDIEMPKIFRLSSFIFHPRMEDDILLRFPLFADIILYKLAVEIRWNMRPYILQLFIVFSLFLLFVLPISGCSEKSTNPQEKSDLWDIDKDGIPKFVATNYIETDKIYRISKFRSSIGHDYSDAFESCRSMKHYFEPKSDLDWSTINIYCPVSGKITRVDEEWAGTKLEIESEDYPVFRFSIFHIFKARDFKIDDAVTAGEVLGTHIGSQTMSDIAVIVNDPTKQGRMISYFETLSDAIFQIYTSRGVLSRQEMIISKEQRDAHPLICAGDVFSSADSLENWVILQ